MKQVEEKKRKDEGELKETQDEGGYCASAGELTGGRDYVGFIEGEMAPGGPIIIPPDSALPHAYN